MINPISIFWLIGKTNCFSYSLFCRPLKANRMTVCLLVGTTCTYPVHYRLQWQWSMSLCHICAGFFLPSSQCECCVAGSWASSLYYSSRLTMHTSYIDLKGRRDCWALEWLQLADIGQHLQWLHHKHYLAMVLSNTFAVLLTLAPE